MSEGEKTDPVEQGRQLMMREVRREVMYVFAELGRHNVLWMLSDLYGKAMALGLEFDVAEMLEDPQPLMERVADAAAELAFRE